ncbi:MAG: FAD-dependent oxidoreductase [bacterium]
MEKTPLVADIVTFGFERPQGYEYRPGQWFVITFPGPAGPYDHHFSHSSSPTEPFLEFTTRMRGSDFKNALDALPLGTEVEIEGPFGAFTPQEGLERVAFVTGGIGITCVRSILRWLTDTRGRSSTDAPPQEIVLLLANRSQAGVPFREELEQMEAALPGLRVVHVLSRPGARWPGHRGHIDVEILTRELPGPPSWAYYLSGPPSFCESMRELLVGWGIGPGSIKMERFDGYE